MNIQAVQEEINRILFDGDTENANKDSNLISTKKELISGVISKETMLNGEFAGMIAEEHRKGGIHIHDLTDRMYDCINCCLFDMASVLKGGLTMKGIKLAEPTSIESCMGLIKDIIMNASSQQYGGFTVPEIDSVIAPYVVKALENSRAYYREQGVPEDLIEQLAQGYIIRHLKQGWQALETGLNVVENATGQTPFVTFTFGLDQTEAGRLVSHSLLDNRIKGIGEAGSTPVFPKLVLLHRDEINGNLQAMNADLYAKSIQCSAKRMYPDYLSLNAGYLGEMFDKYGKAISPMGCRAFLSPWYDENKQAVFTGRANCGAVTINLVRCAIEAQGSEMMLFKKIDERFDLALQVHLKTYNRLKKVKASTNPLLFCEGGCHIKLDPNETIKRALDTFTWSFGFIGLEEVSYHMTGRHLHEDNYLAIRILNHMKRRIEEAKEEHGMLFALYATPSESLCYRFNKLDEKEYGVIEGVTDKDYYMNSFHVDVREPISALKKQLVELPLFEIATGGRIIYNEYPHSRNLTAMRQVIDHAMSKGFYYGVNLQLDQCQECGESGEFKDHICPTCGSDDILEINRTCGYLGCNKVDKKSRYNKGKQQEISHRHDHFGNKI